METDKVIVDASGTPIRSPESPVARARRYGLRSKTFLVAAAATVAFLAGVIGNLDMILQLLLGESPAVGTLQVAGISVDSYRPDYSALIDFRVINTGKKILLINGVIFKTYYVKETPTDGILKVSGTYDLDISNLRKEGDTAEVAVAHEVKPNEADRLAIRLVAKDLRAGEFRKWGFEISFRTSEGIVPAGFLPTDPFATNFVMLPWNLDLSSAPPHLNPALQSKAPGQ